MNGGIVSEYCAPMAVPPCFFAVFFVCCRLLFWMSCTVIYAISVQLTTSCYLIDMPRYAVNCVIMIYCSDVSGTAAVARYMTPRDLLDRAGAARSMCARDIPYCVFSSTASARANNTALVFASPTVLPHEPTSTSSDARVKL